MFVPLLQTSSENSFKEKMNSQERTCVAGILCVTTSEGSLHG